MSGRIVTIDGPAGSGKSTLSKRLAAELGFIHFDSGALYRAITLYFIRKGLSKPEEWAANVAEVPLKAKGSGTTMSVLLGDEVVDKQIRTAPVSNLVSPVSAVISVRKRVNAAAMAFAENADVVAEGRDMGTVVFSNAQMKFYLDASPLERAKRRLADELARGREVKLETLLAEQEARDFNDRNKPWGALRVAQGAIVLDTTDMSPDEVLDALLSHTRKRFALA